MTGSKDTFLVVGGGISGLLAALFAAESGCQVNLLEQADQLGGLLGEAWKHEDYHFDFGTHFLTNTCDDDFDDLVFSRTPGLLENSWTFPFLRCGHYYKGLNEDTVNLSLSRLEADERAKCGQSLIEAECCEDLTNLATLTKSIYGDHVQSQVFDPIMKKLTGESSVDLSVDSRLIFGLSRLAFGSQAWTEHIKSSSPLMDKYLSFHHNSKGANKLKVFYPKTGVGAFVERLRHRLEKLGVRILTSSSLDGLEKSNSGEWQACINGDHQHFSRLVWTVGLPPLLKLLNRSEVMSGLRPPKLRGVSLYHYIFSGEIRTNINFAYVYDPAFKSFRVTLYPGNQTSMDQYVTVEVLHEKGEVPPSEDQIFQELKEMDFISQASTLKKAKVQSLQQGFPIKMVGDEETMRKVCSGVEGVDQLDCLGRAKGKAFFMIDVLREAGQWARENSFL